MSLIGPASLAAEPPVRIGRVAAVSGTVQYRSPAGDWSSALVNEPVAAGVGIRSARDSIAELRIAGDRIALAGESEVKFLRLDSDVAELALAQGRIGLRLGDNAAKTVEVDLPAGAVWLAAPGEYDIAVGDAHHSARIQVFSGKAEVGGGLAGDTLVAAAPDAFDAEWRIRPAAPSPQVALSVTGSEALAANGDWESDDTFGEVWFPKSLPEGWAPFRDGRWRYLAPWGWTWIDAADWGFAPSHYGGWERVNDRWAWVPGPRRGEPGYSPAKVAFLGTPNIGLSRPGNDGAAVGWFPLAPDESPKDGSNAHFRNRRAASVVPRAVFAGGQPVQAALLDLPEWRLDNAPIVLGALGIPPLGDGGTGYVAETAPPQVTPDRVVSVPLETAAILRPQLLAKARQIVVTHIEEMMAHMPRHLARAAPPMRRAATASFVRPPRVPSTSTAHSSHNRPHLAAARGGVLLR